MWNFIASELTSLLLTHTHTLTLTHTDTHSHTQSHSYSHTPCRKQGFQCECLHMWCVLAVTFPTGVRQLSSPTAVSCQYTEKTSSHSNKSVVTGALKSKCQSSSTVLTYFLFILVSFLVISPNLMTDHATSTSWRCYGLIQGHDRKCYYLWWLLFRYWLIGWISV